MYHLWQMPDINCYVEGVDQVHSWAADKAESELYNTDGFSKIAQRLSQYPKT